MHKLTILEQVDPYNPDNPRYAVCGTIDGSRCILSNHESRETAAAWIQQYSPDLDEQFERELHQLATATERRLSAIGHRDQKRNTPSPSHTAGHDDVPGLKRINRQFTQR